MDNLWGLFGCTVVTDFMSKMFRFSIVSGCWVNTSDIFTYFLFSFSKHYLSYSLALLASGIIFIKLAASNSKCSFSFFFFDVSLNNNYNNSKLNSSTTAFKYNVFEFFHFCFPYTSAYNKNIHHYIFEKQKSKDNWSYFNK